MIDFKSWLIVEPDQRKKLAEDDPPLDLDQKWAEFGRKVINRVRSDDYQNVVTYCLLLGGTPAVIAQIIRRYVETGELPWRK